jgi:hypothetical protein
MQLSLGLASNKFCFLLRYYLGLLAIYIKGRRVTTMGPYGRVHIRGDFWLDLYNESYVSGENCRREGFQSAGDTW